MRDNISWDNINQTTEVPSNKGYSVEACKRENGNWTLFSYIQTVWGFHQGSMYLQKWACFCPFAHSPTCIKCRYKFSDDLDECCPTKLVNGPTATQNCHFP